MNLKSNIAYAANHSGLLDGYTLLRKTFLKSHVVVLIYHRIAPKEDFCYLKPLHPDVFEEQIVYLVKNYKIISLDDFSHIMQHKCFPNEKIAIITFDDGYNDNFLYAYPILKKYNVPATIFLSTGNIENEKPFWCDEISYLINNTMQNKLRLKKLGCYDIYTPREKNYCINDLIEKIKRNDAAKRAKLIDNLTHITKVDLPDNFKNLVLSWKDVKKMSNNNIHFGAHTVTHTILTNLKLVEAQYEIFESKKMIETHIDQEIKSFSYPNGTCKDINRDIVNLVKKAGFSCAVTTVPSLSTKNSDLLTIGRVNGSIHNFNNFKATISGLYADYLLNFKNGKCI